MLKQQRILISARATRFRSLRIALTASTGLNKWKLKRSPRKQWFKAWSRPRLNLKKWERRRRISWRRWVSLWKRAYRRIRKTLAWQYSVPWKSSRKRTIRCQLCERKIINGMAMFSKIRVARACFVIPGLSWSYERVWFPCNTFLRSQQTSNDDPILNNVRVDQNSSERLERNCHLLWFGCP